MMKNPKPTFSVVFAVIVIFGTVLSCNFGETTEKKTNLFSHSYSISSGLLLDALESGKVNVFSPIAEEPPSTPAKQQIAVPWTQDDYFRIANALYESIWGETLDSWQLHTMDFALGCEELDIGLQDGNFEFFRIAQTDGHESRLQLIINIRPRHQYVFITKNEYFPKVVEWGAIDLGQNQSSANEILKIAENAGGQEKRLSVENACNISMWLSPDSASYHGWEVNYTRRDDGTTLFNVNIDPFTGDVEIP